MKTVFVKPNGKTVIDPKTGQKLPEAGARVERSVFWRRRLAAADVVEATPPAPKKPKTTEPEEHK